MGCVDEVLGDILTIIVKHPTVNYPAYLNDPRDRHGDGTFRPVSINIKPLQMLHGVVTN